MGLGFGFNLGPFRWGGSFRGGGGSGEALLYVIIAGFVLMAARAVLEIALYFVVIGIVLFVAHFLSVFLMRLSVPKHLRNGDAVNGFVMYSLLADFAALVIGLVVAFFVPKNFDPLGQMSTLETVGAYLGWRVIVIVSVFALSLLVKLLEIREQRRSLNALEDYRRANFVISKNPCSQCGGEVQRNKKDIFIHCDKCKYEHSYLQYPDLADDWFVLELKQREHVLKQREEERQRELAQATERRLDEQSVDAWRRQARSAMNDVDLEVRKVLNPSPGDVVNKSTLGNVFEIAVRSLLISDPRLRNNLAVEKEAIKSGRVLQQLAEQLELAAGIRIDSASASVVGTSEPTTQ